MLWRLGMNFKKGCATCVNLFIFSIFYIASENIFSQFQKTLFHVLVNTKEAWDYSYISPAY